MFTINKSNYKLSLSLEENIITIKEIFNNDDTLMIRKFQNRINNLKCAILFIDGMADNNTINENIIRPIVENNTKKLKSNPIEYLQYEVIVSSQCEKTKNVNNLINGLISGNTILFLEGVDHGLIIQSMGWEYRDINEPKVETVVRGPREGFTEVLAINLSLIRRKVKNNKLKFKYMTIGDMTNTKVCVCYIEGLASDRILNELLEQLNNISIDGVLDSKYIQEYINKQPFSLFETTHVTEKPDVVVGKLLEGRLALIVDGTPVVVTLPFLFIEVFQAADDYYTNYYFASLNRIIRLFGFVMTISIPAVYLALVTFHQELIPTPLLMSIYASRLAVPLPTIFELIILLVAFEILREAGTRMPVYVGQTLSIVGALVLGTAAVEAKLVSAPVIIIVGLSGITSFMIPSITGSSTIIKFALVGFSAVLGLYGYIIGIAFLLIHLIKLKSFGVPIMSNFTSLEPREMKDTHIRVPRWAMKRRPKILGQKNPARTDIHINRGDDK